MGDEGGAAVPHLQLWPRVQHLGRPASSLIPLSRGDPAFCQCRGQQQAKGLGMLLFPRGSGHSTCVPPSLEYPGGRQGRGWGWGLEGRAQKGGTCFLKEGFHTEAMEFTALSRTIFLNRSHSLGFLIYPTEMLLALGPTF